MLDTLQKMSGITHRSYIDSKTVTTDKQRLFMQNESKLSYTMTTKEVPVIMYNDMAFIAERNSIVFRAGDAPVWNRNQTILPMSWRLFQNTIVHAGHDYSLQTIPTLSSALDFDIRKNQPDFMKMLDKRMKQACLVETVCNRYKDAYGYTDYEIEQLDPENYPDEIMDIINKELARQEARDRGENDMDEDEDDSYSPDWMSAVQANVEQERATQEQAQKQQLYNQKVYAGRMLSREDLVSMTSGVNHSFDKDIISVYVDIKGDMWSDSQNFRVQNQSLCGTDGTLYIEFLESSKDLDTLNELAKDKNSRVFQDANIDKKEVSSLGSYRVTDDFYRFLVSKSRWNDIAKGRFESGMMRLMQTQ